MKSNLLNTLKCSCVVAGIMLASSTPSLAEDQPDPVEIAPNCSYGYIPGNMYGTCIIGSMVIEEIGLATCYDLCAFLLYMP